ncbi:MAG: hypothetical protein IJU51_00990, partial [Clostridia bacterium]|nr:hypothetical protein [Clostridia bacterium]
MKRLTAILAAALVMMSVSLPVMAEPDDSSTEAGSQTSVSEQSPDNESSQDEAPDESDAESTEDTSAQASMEESTQESTEEASPDDSVSEENSEDSNNESPAEESKAEESSKTESKPQESKPQSSKETSGPENVKTRDYRIDEAGMKISIPSDMYVITRNTDKEDPVLAVNRTTKEEVMKNFLENDIYLRVNPKDFTFVVNVTVSESEDTKAIGELSSLSEEKLQSIIDRLLDSEIYTGCTKGSYGGLLFLTFNIGYETGGTKVEGVQQYTINDGKCIKITYQSTGDGDSAANRQAFNKMMDSLRFDGIRYEPKTEEKREEAKPLTLSDIDIRYIYLIIASVVGIIALMIMIIAGIRYKKTKALAARQKKIEEERNKKKTKVTFMDHDEEQTEIFSDTEKKKESENEKQREKSKDKQAGNITADNDVSQASLDDTDKDADMPSDDMNDGLDMFGRPTVNMGEDQTDLGKTDIIRLPEDIFDTGVKETPKETKAAYTLAGPDDGDEIIKEPDEDRSAPDDSELFRAIEESNRSSSEPVVNTQKKDSDVVFADHGRKRRTEIEQIGSTDSGESLTEAGIGTESKPSISDADKTAAAVESSFFAQMVERLRETNAQVGQDISRMEKNKSGSILEPAGKSNTEKNSTTNEKDQGDDTMSAYTSTRKDIELEISKSEDGSLVIGALNNNDGSPVGIEIRDASNFKEDRDREMARLGFEVANDNEIYNAWKEEKAENPFVVRAKDEHEKGLRSSGKEASRYDKLFGQSKDKDSVNGYEKRFGKGAAAGPEKGKTRSSDKSAKETEKNKAADAASKEVKVMTEEQPRKTIIPAGTAFDGDSGIAFEVVPAPKREVT